MTKHLEPILGRHNPAGTVSEIERFGGLRYEVEPMDEPHRTRALEKLYREGQQAYLLRIRDDLPDAVRAALEGKPMEVAYGERLDTKRNITVPREIHFIGDEPTPLSFELAVWILNHDRYGQFFEEVDAVRPPSTGVTVSGLLDKVTPKGTTGGPPPSKKKGKKSASLETGND